MQKALQAKSTEKVKTERKSEKDEETKAGLGSIYCNMLCGFVREKLRIVIGCNMR